MSVGSDSSEKRKPETIEFYNKAKYGVDVADQMTRQYSVKAGTRQSSVAFFYNILDLACINAFVLYKERRGNSIPRRDLIFKLETKLTEDYLAEKRARSASEQESSRITKKYINNIYFITVSSLVEWLKHRTDDQHSLGSKPTCAILLCPWERHFTAHSPAWWS